VPTAVEELERTFLRGQWAHLQQLVSARYPEDLHIDFKRKSNPADIAWSREDRQNLSIALSGFANADGGIIVWGGDARPGADGIDCLQSLVPIVNIDRFAADLQSLSAQYASPGIPEVRTHKIDNPADGSGIAVTVIPQSDAAPHMAVGPGVHMYYQRVLDRFVPMEHFAIADMMGRRPQPRLHLDIGVRVSKVGSSGNGPLGAIVVKAVVKNVGRGLMRFPCVSIEAPVGMTVSQYGGIRAIRPFEPMHPPANWWIRVIGSADTVVYPDDEIDAVELRFDFEGLEPTFTDLKVRFVAVAQDCAPVEVIAAREGLEFGQQWARVLGRA